MTTQRSPRLFVHTTLFFSFFGFFLLNLVAVHGLQNGIHLTLLGWSCYVMCLPFFGGGIMFSPLFIFLKRIPTYVCEMLAWISSITLHLITLKTIPQIYQYTPITHFIHWCITHPFPYWILFILCFAPVVIVTLFEKYAVPKRRFLYYKMRFFFIMASLLFLGYVAVYDLIILSNIHA